MLDNTVSDTRPLSSRCLHPTLTTGDVEHRGGGMWEEGKETGEPGKRMRSLASKQYLRVRARRAGKGEVVTRERREGGCGWTMVMGCRSEGG